MICFDLQVQRSYVVVLNISRLSALTTFVSVTSCISPVLRQATGINYDLYPSGLDGRGVCVQVLWAVGNVSEEL